MSKNMTVVLPQKIYEKLDKAKQETGLTKSEIARRGIVNEIDKLKVNEPKQ